MASPFTDSNDDSSAAVVGCRRTLSASLFPARPPATLVLTATPNPRPI
ncbi:MAG: hypothetical protein ACKVVO_13375 [Opitutaceae bacterium]